MKAFVLPFLCCCSYFAGAQNFTPSTDRRLSIQKSATPVKLDGLLDEPAWQTADVARGFHLIFPVDTGFATDQSEARMTFDDQNIYIGVVCYQRREDYIVQTLRRDFGPGTGDVFNILIDPSKDGLNGFTFGVGPLNVQREALISSGDMPSFEWDNKWYSRVSNYDDRWVAEIAIPFKTLRYNVQEDINTWHVNFTRARLKNFEVTSWIHVPIVYRPQNLAFTGTLTWATPPPKPGVNISLIPYVIGNQSVDYKRNENTLELIERKGRATGSLGGDVKVAITSGLNLDLAFNPDFSQVEVDQQVANLSRFELFFPELRQFFLENRDMFALFGFPNSRPFFSRRIGLAYNPLSQQYEKVPILAGARLSGKLNDNWRIGALNMQTGKREFDETNVQPGSNFTVLTAQRKLFTRSALSGIFVNKHNFLDQLTEPQRVGWQPGNQVAGVEYNHYSRDNRWEAESYYHRSFSPDPKQRGATFAQYIGYNDRKYNLFCGYNRIDSTYSADAGFVPRPGIQGLYTGGGLVFYPKRGWLGKALANVRLGVLGDLTYSLKGRETDRDVYYNISSFFKNQSILTFGLYDGYTYLFEDFDLNLPLENGERALPGSRGYSYRGFRGEFVSSTSFNFQADARVNAGAYFNGNYLSLQGRLAYRTQPFGVFSVLFSYNDIRLPQPHPSHRFWLIGPRAELAFSRSLFFSSFFQYNTQFNNFNINTRLQWRFAPVSDLFLVYTDNSYAEQVPGARVQFLSPKNKALVLKVVYWLNV